MRILWHSNAPWVNTGYGVQTRIFLPKIQKAGHELAVSAFYGGEGGILNWQSMKVYPKGFDPYGGDIIGAHAANFGADIVISLIDAWVYNPAQFGAHVRWCPWFPVDMAPLPHAVLEKVTQAFERIVYSQFAWNEVNKTGLTCEYVPHGVETEIYKPLPNRDECKTALGFPKDKFIVGIVGANKGYPPRKSWDRMLMAFRDFKRIHKDAWLYIHAHMGPQMQGLDLLTLAQSLGLEVGKDFGFVDQYRNVVGGYSDIDMAVVYNALDVKLLTSNGEGFGVPILEAQSCGTPVIIGGWTSMPELLFSGWAVPISESDPDYTPLGAYQNLPRVGGIVDCLKQAYKKATNVSVREAARAGALPYNAQKVTDEYWLPTLEKIRIKAGL